jgi:hypothetical protein
MMRAAREFTEVAILATVTPGDPGPDPDPVPPPTCTGTHECEEGAVRCYYGAKDACLRGADGCFKWTASEYCADWTENMVCTAFSSCAPAPDCARYTEAYSGTRPCCPGLVACTYNSCYTQGLAGFCMVAEGHKTAFAAACYSNRRDSNSGRCLAL